MLKQILERIMKIIYDQHTHVSSQRRVATSTGATGNGNHHSKHFEEIDLHDIAVRPDQEMR